MRKPVLFFGALMMGWTVWGAAAEQESRVDWFDAGISSYASWPADGADYAVADQGVWSNTASATLSGRALAVDAAEPLTFTAASSKPVSAKPKVTVTVQFSAYDADDLPEVSAGMKGAVIVVSGTGGTTYWVLASDNEESPRNVWTDTSIAASVDTDVTLSITLDESGNVTYDIGEAFYSASIVLPADAAVSGVRLSGTGKASALSGSVIDASLALSIEIPSIEHAEARVSVNGVEVGVDGGYVSVMPGDTLSVTYVAASGYTVRNGEFIIDHVGRDTTIDVSGVTVVAAEGWDAVTEKTDLADIPGLGKYVWCLKEYNNVTGDMIARWAKAHAVTYGDTIDLLAFALNCAPTADKAALMPKLTIEMVDGAPVLGYVDEKALAQYNLVPIIRSTDDLRTAIDDWHYPDEKDGSLNADDHFFRAEFDLFEFVPPEE